MPTAFQKELVTLARRLADLCELVASALEEATRSVLESDHTLGGRVREETAAAAALGAACEDQACALPALHAPREGDVKAVVAAVHAAADLTRMGGLAREVAEPRRVPMEVRPALGRLGGHAVAAARALRRLLAGEGGAGVADAVALAGVAERELRKEAGGFGRPYGVGAAVDVVLLAAVYGRFAGTSALIARRAAGFAPVGA
jgi:phosphate transport system protein